MPELAFRLSASLRQQPPPVGGREPELVWQKQKRSSDHARTSTAFCGNHVFGPFVVVEPTICLGYVEFGSSATLLSHHSRRRTVNGASQSLTRLLSGRVVGVGPRTHTAHSRDRIRGTAYLTYRRRAATPNQQI